MGCGERVFRCVCGVGVEHRGGKGREKGGGGGEKESERKKGRVGERGRSSVLCSISSQCVIVLVDMCSVEITELAEKEGLTDSPNRQALMYQERSVCLERETP